MDTTTIQRWCTGFVKETRDTLADVLPGEPRMVGDVDVNERHSLATFSMCVDLKTIGAEGIARLLLNYRVGADRSGQHVAVHTSSFKVGVPRSGINSVLPYIRYEYDREPARWVSAHIHVHAENGMLTRVRTLAGIKAPDELKNMHYPVGGDRFRPCLEDFLYFLIKECGFQAKDGWKQILTARRDEYRRKQARSVIRDYHNEAADVLRQLGYSVSGSPTKVPSPPHTEW